MPTEKEGTKDQLSWRAVCLAVACALTACFAVTPPFAFVFWPMWFLFASLLSLVSVVLFGSIVIPPEFGVMLAMAITVAGCYFVIVTGWPLWWADRARSTKSTSV